MTQSPFPPPGAGNPQNYSMEPMHPSTSGAAVTSLVLGLLLCLSFLSAIPAVIFGFVGLSKTKNPMVRGRGMAIAGLVLGLVNIVGSTGLILLFAVGSAAPRMTGRTWVQLNSTNQAASAQFMTSQTYPAGDLTTVEQQISALGPMRDMTTTSVNLSTTNGMTSCTLAGLVNFGNSPTAHTFTMSLVKESGRWKVAQCTISP